MIKIPKEMLIQKIKEKSGLSENEISSKVKDKLDQLSGLISEEGALHIIANELGVKVMEDTGKLQIKNVLAGMRNVELTAKVLKVYEIREFERDGRKGKVGNFLIGDETGTMRVVAWNDKADLLTNLNEEDIVKIENGYARENRGRNEIHLGDRTTITVNPKDAKKIDVQPRTMKKIADLNENDNDVEIMGTIVQVFDPRFFAVHPETGKRLQEKEGKFYYNEEQVEPAFSYVTNLFLDDGSENIRVVLWRNQSQKLFGMDHEQIVEMKDTSFEEMKNELLGKIVKFVGRTNKNEMFDRIEFIPQLVFTDPKPDEAIKRLDQEAEKAVEEEEVVKPVSRTQEPEETVKTQETVDIKSPVQPVEETPEPKLESKPEPVKEESSGSDDIEEIEDLDKLDSL